MGKKWKKKAPILPWVLTGLVLLCLAFVYFGRPATERALVSGFYRNLPDFIELRSMLATNWAMDPAALSGVSADAPIWSQEHYRRYRALVHHAGVIRLSQEGPDVRFQLAGLAGGGKQERVGVLWTETEPDILVASITEFHKKRAQLDHAYCRLTNSWYMWIAK